MKSEAEINSIITDFSAIIEKTKPLIHKNTDSYNYLQNYLYFMHYLLFSFTESIIILYRENKFHAASVLLRSVVEGHINIVYHQLGDTNKKLALSAKESADSRLTVINKLGELIRKYSNLESQDPRALLSKKYLEDIRQDVNKQRQGILNGNDIAEKDKALNMEEKARKCDEENKNIEKGHFERMYTVIYRYLSPVAHLNIESINTIIRTDGNKAYKFDEGTIGKTCVVDAIGICVAYIKDLYENNLIEGKIHDEVLSLEKKLGEVYSDFKS
ncbi:MAG: DUF5677 domain-containing protein [Patescibacteria group bacterium]